MNDLQVPVVNWQKDALRMARRADRDACDDVPNGFNHKSRLLKRNAVAALFCH